MASDHESDSPRPQDGILSKVDALLRRHRGGEMEAALDATPESEIPTLTDLLEGSAPAHATASLEAAASPDTPALGRAAEEWLALLRPEIERVAAAALSARLPQAIQEQVRPEVMARLGEELDRLRDAMRTTVESVVREIIEREVKRALKALLKERER